MSLSGKTLVVTGAASGIGASIAAKVRAARPARLILLDIDGDGLANIAKDAEAGEVERHIVDLTDVDAVTRLFDPWAAAGLEIDFLFNCAGIPAGTPSFPETAPSRIAAIVGLNLTGLIVMTRLCVDRMAARGGSILNIASTSGLRPYLTGAVYAASKAGVIMFTQSCADLAQRNIRVNALCPGIVRTPFLEKTGSGGQIADWLRKTFETMPMLSPDEVAEAAIRLALRPDAAGSYEILEASQKKEAS